MGIFSSLIDAFKDGYSGSKRETPALSRSTHSIPHTKDLMYPDILPRFDEIAEGGHRDPRAAVYTMLLLNLNRKRPFSDEELSALDFGGGQKAFYVLAKKGLIREIDRGREILSIYSKDELKGFLRERRLPVGGRKAELAERLLGDGFKIDRRKHRHRLFEVTENGAGAIGEYRSDEKRAILLATNALQEGDFSGAISAYRGFDSKWGFAHTSGKNHTIFAHYDIPFSRFTFIMRYPMRELKNSDDFKNALRACLFAGLMRGCQDRGELANCFEEVCHEPIRCPGIVKYFKFGDFDDEDRDCILAAMRENTALDHRYVLEYYISRVMYLSRKVE